MNSRVKTEFLLLCDRYANPQGCVSEVGARIGVMGPPEMLGVSFKEEVLQKIFDRFRAKIVVKDYDGFHQLSHSDS